MAEPINTILDDSTGVELPQMRVDSDILNEEKKKAKYSKSREFIEIREYWESRKVYYQSFLPGNIPVESITEEERGKYWAVANMLINEIDLFLGSYDNAVEAVKEANEQ